MKNRKVVKIVLVSLASFFESILLLSQLAFPAEARYYDIFAIKTPSTQVSASGLSDEDALALLYAAEDPFRWVTGHPVESSDRWKESDDPIPEGIPERIAVKDLPKEYLDRFYKNYPDPDYKGASDYVLLRIRYNTEEKMTEHLTETVSGELSARFLDSRYFFSSNGYLYSCRLVGPQDSYSLVHADLVRTEDTADRVVFRAEIPNPVPASTREIFNQDLKGAPDNTTFDYVFEKQNGKWILTSFEIPYDVLRRAISPQTGDSTVFLLPAASLSLGGLLLAAKKRRRTS